MLPVGPGKASNLCRRPRLLPICVRLVSSLCPACGRLHPFWGCVQMHFFGETFKWFRRSRLFQKAWSAQPLERERLSAIQWIERIVFSLPASTWDSHTLLNGVRPIAADLRATASAADPISEMRLSVQACKPCASAEESVTESSHTE